MNERKTTQKAVVKFTVIWNFYFIILLKKMLKKVFFSDNFKN